MSHVHSAFRTPSGGSPDNSHDRAGARNLVSRKPFDPSAEVVTEEFLGPSVEIGPIFRSSKSVAFVRVDNIDHLTMILLDSFDNLFRFGLFDPRIIGPLPYQQRSNDS